MDTAGAEDPPLPPPSYEDALQMDTSSANIDMNIGASRDQARQPLVSDSPHESDDEEVATLKAELRRLRLEKLEATKRQLRDQISRERTNSGGSGMRSASGGVSGSQSSSRPTQYQSSGYSAVSQSSAGLTPFPVVTATGVESPAPPDYAVAPAGSSTIIHPVATSTYVPPTPPEDKDSGGSQVCCIVCTFFTLVAVIVAVVSLSGYFSFLKMSTFEDYNTTSRNYDNQRFAMGTEVLISMLAFHCKNPLQQMHLLDAGCGTGNYSKAMLNYGVGHVTLIDGSEGMLQKARAKLANEIALGKVDDIRVHAMPTIPYHDAQFDAVMFNLVLHHLETDADGKQFAGIEATVREARRVIKMDGVLSISTVLPSEFSPKQWFDRLEETIGDRYYKKFPEARQWMAILEKCGFTTITITTVKADQPRQITNEKYDPEGPSRKTWRDGDSYWAVATRDELVAVEQRIGSMKRNGTLAQYVSEHDKTDGFYDAAFIFAKPV